MVPEKDQLLDADKGLGIASDDECPADNRRSSPDNTGDLPQLQNLRLVVRDSACFRHVNVSFRGENSIAQLALKACHQSEGNNERHHSHRDADH